MRIATLLDGNEQYGLPQAVANIVSAHDPRRVESIGLFLGDGEDLHGLKAAFSRVHHFHVGALSPLRRHEGPRFDPVFLARRAVRVHQGVTALKCWCRENGVDIVHTHLPRLARIAWKATRSLPTRRVMHLHGPYTLAGWQSRQFVGFARRGIDRFLAISEFVANTAPPPIRERIDVIYNGVPVARMQAAARRGAFREKYKLAPNQPLVGIFGAVVPRKGHVHFIEAAARVASSFPNARFAIVGGPIGIYAETTILADLFTRIERLGLKDRMIYTGFLSDATSYMADFDVSVMPTIPVPDQPGEGFGMVLIESMAHGVPVIASDCGAPREFITNAVNGLLVPPGDDARLAQAMSFLLEDDDRRRRIGDAGLRTVTERFDARVVAARIEDIYAGLCHESPRDGIPATCAVNT